MKSYLGWEVDFSKPVGEPSLIPPDSVTWQVFKNPVAMLTGGIAAVLLEFADPRIRSGVWEHSTFKTDPIGRSLRTAMAAMVGTYGPESAARKVIAGVNQMHARVKGQTPDGESYDALDVELLAWVGATSAWGFVTAYDRFVKPLSHEEQCQFYLENEPVGRLYGVDRNLVREPADFDALLQRQLPRFEPHPITTEFLEIMRSGKAARWVPPSVHCALANAAVSILPGEVRERLELGSRYDLRPSQTRLVRFLGRVGERGPILNAPPARASVRLGLPATFLYRRPKARQRLLERSCTKAQ